MSGSKVISQVEVLSVADGVRRRRWTDADKIRIVEESLRGHRQGLATANRYGLSRSLLTRWRKEYRCGLLGASEAPSFTAVAIADDRVPSASPGPATRVAEAVEITLTNGRRLKVGSSIEAAALARLVQVLDRA